MYHTLFIIEYFTPHHGGAEQLFHDIAQYCSQKNMRVTVLTSRYDKSLKKIEKKDDVTIYRVGSGRKSFLWSSLIFALQQRSLIASVDHIHTSSYTAALSSWLIGKRRNKKVSLTLHEVYHHLRYHLKGWKGRLYLRYERLIIHIKRYQIVTPSLASKETIVKHYPQSFSRILVIPNCIDTTFWNPQEVQKGEKKLLITNHHLTSTDQLFLFMGRLGYEKGLPYLIEAFAQAKEKYPNIRLVLIASRTATHKSKSEKKLIARTERHLKDNYLLSSTIRKENISDEELRTWITLSFRGVVPSLSEGFSYAAHHMQAMGLPLIVSDIAVFRESLDASSTQIVAYGKTSERARAIENSLSSTATSSRNYPIREINYEQYYQIFRHSDLPLSSTSKD